MERLDNITQILDRLNEIIDEKEALTELEMALKYKAKLWLKGKKWNRYLDETNKVSVEIVEHNEETVDVRKVKFLLKNENDIESVLHINKKEFIEVITPNMRKKLSEVAKR